MTGYRLFVSEKRTVVLWLWNNGKVEVALRASADHVWGPPISLKEEK